MDWCLFLASLGSNGSHGDAQALAREFVCLYKGHIPCTLAGRLGWAHD